MRDGKLTFSLSLFYFSLMCHASLNFYRTHLKSPVVFRYVNSLQDPPVAT